MTNILTRFFGSKKPEAMKQDETKKPVTIALESKGNAKVEPENAHFADLHTQKEEVKEVEVNKTPPPSNDYFAKLHEVKQPDAIETNPAEEVNETPNTQGTEEEPTEDMPH